MSLGQRKQNTINVDNSSVTGVIQTRCRYENADTTSDLNASTSFGTTYAQIVGTAERTHADFEKIDAATLRAKFTGRVMAIINLYFTGASQRQVIHGQFEVEGTATGPIAANSYIRNSAAINDSSLHLTTEFDVTADDDIKFSTIRGGSTGGTVTLNGAGNSDIILIKVE